MLTFIEGVMALLPADAGGRRSPVAPRDGSYRPFARVDGASSSDILRIRLIEGPPLLSPGHEALVVAEVEKENLVSSGSALVVGTELSLLEHDERLVGILNVMRLWRGAVTI